MQPEREASFVFERSRLGNWANRKNPRNELIKKEGCEHEAHSPSYANSILHSPNLSSISSSVRQTPPDADTIKCGIISGGENFAIAAMNTNEYEEYEILKLTWLSPP